MDKYRKNFILCDSVLYYCLLCDELFRGIPSVERHIRWDEHRKNVKTQDYLPKLRKDFIYKVEDHFYCQICNFVVSDINAVTKHIDNDEHKAMKTDPKSETKIIGHYDSGFILINKAIIDMAQWNSIVDNKCLICNIEVENIPIHMGFKEHIINLINSKTECKNERYYRKINDDKYHCFSCKKVFSAQELNIHWPNCENIDARVNMFLDIDESKIKTQKEEEGESSKSIGDSSHSTEGTATVDDQLVGPLQDYFLVDRTADTATCTHCQIVMAVDCSPMVEHMKTHLITEALETNPIMAEDSEPCSDASSDEEVVYYDIIDSGKRRSKLSIYGKDNFIKLNFNGSKGWCKVCDRSLSGNINVFKQHVNGRTHQGNLELQGHISPKRHDTRDVGTKSILQCRLEYSFDKESFVIDRFSIDVFSFFLLCQIEDPNFKKTKCYACNRLLPQGQERKHCGTTKHKNKFLAAKVVMSPVEEGHFFREIRTNYFHCGFCNITFPFLETMLKHILCVPHKTLQFSKTDTCLDGLKSVKFNTESDDIYMKLVDYGFRNKYFAI